MKKTAGSARQTTPNRDKLIALLRHLPTGFVLLGGQGEVILYSEAEALFAGRDAAAVEGRDFFREVAPCSDVRELGGAFRRAMADANAPLDVDLDFTFPFARGPVDARVRMRKAMVGGEPYGLVLIDDNTTLKQTQRALQAALGEARELALRDPLTSLYNRRHLDLVLPAELKRARRHSYPLSAMMVDVDRFKAVNDRFGHAAGDRVLVEVAHALLKTLRASDVCVRMGGEEFCAILPEADAEVMRKVVRRLRRAIHAIQQPDHPKLRITASIGVATRNGPWSTDSGPVTDAEVRTAVTDLIDSADRALYQAKKGGRDRVAYADG